MKFAIFGNTYQPKKSLHALRLFELLKKQGAEICMCREFYQFLTADLKMEVPVDALLEGNDFTADMVISIGGDGTFLKAARRVGRKQIPILGINTGRLGFLADVSPEEMEVTFEEIQAGRYSVEERSVLQLICNDRNRGAQAGQFFYDQHPHCDQRCLSEYLSGRRTGDCHSYRLYCVFIKRRRPDHRSSFQYDRHYPGSSAQPQRPSYRHS